MRYFIERASNYEGRPCEEAFQITETHPFLNRPEKFVAFGDDYGINDLIVRDIEKKEWVINIKCLEDLQALQKKYGNLILSRNTITIYDDYVE